MKISGSRKGKTKKPKATGDCYEAAFKFIMDECLLTPENEARYILIHAEVMGQGDIAGMTFGHAFVVKDRALVIDRSNSRNLEMPAFFYYAIGQIQDIGNEHQYTWKEAREKAVEFGTYGPWDLVTESGL